MRDTESKGTILVIDDDRFNRYVAQMVFEREGFRVLCEGSALGLVPKVRHIKPDVILLDIMLPGMSGPEAACELRDTGDTTPIVLWSASTEEDIREKAAQCGADDWVSKTGEQKKLIDAVMRHTNKGK